MTARIAGAVYLLVFLTGGASLVVRGAVGVAAGLIAGLLYVVVTLLFYRLFKPVSARLSLAAALVSLAGIAIGPLAKVNPLLAFGVDDQQSIIRGTAPSAGQRSRHRTGR